MTLPGTSVVTNSNITTKLSDPDLTRPENMISLLDPETFISNDVEAVEAMILATSKSQSCKLSLHVWVCLALALRYVFLLYVILFHFNVSLLVYFYR